jgi:hypothetical protein
MWQTTLRMGVNQGVESNFADANTANQCRQKSTTYATARSGRERFAPVHGELAAGQGLLAMSREPFFC